MTCASLKVCGKVPCEKDRLARCAMSSEKTDGMDLINEVGM